MIKFETGLKLKEMYSDCGAVINYKDTYIVAEFVCGPAGEWFEAQLWVAIETVDEPGEEMWNLRLVREDGLEGQQFDTEGEAILAAINLYESSKEA